jgi:hypothetical protein
MVHQAQQQQPQQQQPADAAAAASGTSNVPIRQECAVPGKDLWVLWRTNFEIDQHYTPIKVRQGGQGGSSSSGWRGEGNAGALAAVCAPLCRAAWRAHQGGGLAAGAAACT